MSSTVKAQSPNHWITREFPENYFFKIIYLLGVLSLHRCVGLSLVVTRGAYSLVVVSGLLIAAASALAKHRLSVNRI